MAALRILLIVLAGSVTAPAMGAELYRCVSAGGAVSFQDVPCAEGQQSRTIPVLVDPVLVDPVRAEPAKRTASRAKATASKPSASKSGSRGSDPRARQRAACEKARKQRDEALDRAGLNRTFETLRALDDRVHEACKGL